MDPANPKVALAWVNDKLDANCSMAIGIIFRFDRLPGQAESSLQRLAKTS